MTTKLVRCPKCNAYVGQKCVTTGRTGKQKKRKDHTVRIHAVKTQRQGYPSLSSTLEKR